MLATEMARQGHFLFRHRSYIPIFLLPPFLVALAHCDPMRWTSPLTLSWEFTCLSVSLAGFAIRIATVGFVPAGTSGRNTVRQIAEVLNTTGLYSATRNPLYLGNFLMWLGIVLTIGDISLILGFSLAFCLYYERIIAAEESYLTEKFGVEFLDWAERTPAFVPRLTSWQSSELTFSVRTVLRREYCGLFGITTAFPAISLAGHLLLEKRLYLEPAWIVVFVIGATCFFVLRYLKKRTRLLHVDGR